MTPLEPAGRSHRDAATLRYDLTRDELASLLDGEPPYRTDQLWQEIRSTIVAGSTNLRKCGGDFCSVQAKTHVTCQS